MLALALEEPGGYTRSMRLGLAIGVAAFALALPISEARADDKTYALGYQGAAGCPNEDAMRTSVAANVHDLSRAAGAKIEIAISLRGDTFVGELVATDQEGNVGHRSVDGEKGSPCSEVARAVAFMAALAIEYGGRIEPKAAPPPPPPKPPPPVQDTPPPPPPPREPTVAFALVAGGEVRGGLADAPRPAGEIGFEVFDPRARVLAPALRLAFVVGGSHLTSPNGSARLWLFAGRLEACPLAFGNARFALRPCASTEAGALLADGENITPARSVTEPWFVAEATLRADLWLSHRVFLEAEGGAVFPIASTRYFFEPNQTLYSAPRLTGRGGLSFGVQLGAK